MPCQFIERDPLPLSLSDRPVVYIRQVHYLTDLVAFMFQITAKNIAKNECAEVADMGKIPNCRPARVHLHFAAKRLEFLDLIRQRIAEFQHRYYDATDTLMFGLYALCARSGKTDERKLVPDPPKGN